MRAVRTPSVPRWRWGEDVGRLAAVLARGGLLAVPTESSYGLAVDPLGRRGVEAVYRVKGRAASKPLPIVIASLEQLPRLGVTVPPGGLGGLETLWPAPLSVVLAVAGEVPAAAGTGTVAVRVPAHAGLRRLLDELGLGLTATSANASGQPPILDPTQLDGLLEGSDAVIVDDGPLAGGAPSTLVAVEAGVISVLRPGRVPVAALRRAAPGLEIRDAFSAAAVEIPVEESR